MYYSIRELIAKLQDLQDDGFARLSSRELDEAILERGCAERKTEMWVYVRSEPDVWTVGFYSPDGRWHSDSDRCTREAAAARVHYLNGGRGAGRPAPESTIRGPEPVY